MGVSVYYYQLPVRVVCLCVYEREISNQSASKKLHYMSDLSKLDALLHKICSKVLLVL